LTIVDRKDLIDQLAKMARSAAIQDLLTDRLKSTDAEQRRLALAAIGQANLKDPPTAWLNNLADILSRKEGALLADAVAAARALRLTNKSPVRFASGALPTSAAMRRKQRLCARRFGRTSGQLAKSHARSVAFSPLLGSTSEPLPRTRRPTCKALVERTTHAYGRRDSTAGALRVDRLLEAVHWLQRRRRRPTFGDGAASAVELSRPLAHGAAFSQPSEPQLSTSHRRPNRVSNWLASRRSSANSPRATFAAAGSLQSTKTIACACHAIGYVAAKPGRSHPHRRPFACLRRSA